MNKKQVFPARTAALTINFILLQSFFLRYIDKKTNEPIFSPDSFGMERFISLLIIIVFNYQVISFVSYAQCDDTLSTKIIFSPSSQEDNTSVTLSTKQVKVKRTPKGIKRNVTVLNPIPSDHDYAALWDALPIQQSISNTLQSDTLLVDHKKSMLYQSYKKLPLPHQTALYFLILREEIGETRGMGGQNTIILQMGNLSDEELISVWIHELGHVVDTGMFMGDVSDTPSPFQDGTTVVSRDDPSTTFYFYSWMSNTQKTEGSTPLDFVTGYAMTDPFEDFAESYTYYVLHGKAFRSMASSSIILQKKYNFLRDIVFQGKEFNTGTSVLHISERNFDATLISFNLHQFLEQ